MRNPVRKNNGVDVDQHGNRKNAGRPSRGKGRGHPKNATKRKEQGRGKPSVRTQYDENSDDFSQFFDDHDRDRSREFPEAQDPDDDTFDSWSQTGSRYAGKTLLERPKKRSLSRDGSIDTCAILAQKRPRDSEIVIPETEQQDNDTVDDGLPVGDGVAIAVDDQLGTVSTPVQPGGVRHSDGASGHMLKNIVTRITDQFAAESGSDFQEMNRTLEKLVGQVASLQRQVSELRAVSSGCSAPSGTKTSKEAWIEFLDSCLPHLAWAFDEGSQCKVFSTCVSRVLVPGEPEADRLTAHAAKCISALMFGMRREKLKKEFAEGAGKRYSEFRYRCVISLIYHVHHNVFARFRSDIPESLPPSLSEISDSQKRADPRTTESSRGHISSNNEVKAVRQSPGLSMSHPDWLKPGFLTREHINAARDFSENLKSGNQSSSKDKVKPSHRDPEKSKPTDLELASHGCKRIYGRIKKGLNSERVAARNWFFEDFGYLAANWSDMKCEVTKDNLQLKWANVVGEEGERLLCSVPEARKNPKGDADTDQWNRKLLSRFVKNSLDMIVLVRHGVRVRPDNSSSTDPSVPREIRRSFNMVEVTARFMSRYVLSTSIEEFLGKSENSIKAIFVVASAFREMAKRLAWEPSTGAADITCESFCMDTLTPSPSVMKRVAHSRLLRMTESQYHGLDLGANAWMRDAIAMDTNEYAPGGETPQSLGEELDPSQVVDIFLL